MDELILLKSSYLIQHNTDFASLNIIVKKKRKKKRDNSYISGLVWFMILMPLYFSYIVAVSFIGGGNRSCQR
jgi:hypothetical protein